MEATNGGTYEQVSGSSSDVSDTVQPDSESIPEDVGRSNDPVPDGKDEIATNESNGETPGHISETNIETGSESDTGRNSGPRVRAVFGFKLDDFRTALNDATGDGEATAVITNSSFNPRDQRQAFIGFVFLDVDYGYEKGVRTTQVYMSNRAEAIQDQINTYFANNTVKSVNLSLSCHYNTTRSSHEFVATISHI